MKITYNYKKGPILVIPDLHLPYQHKDAFAFLKAVKKKYKPGLIINMGDLVDLCSVSNYELNPDFDSPSEEIAKGIIEVKKLAKIFPKQRILWGNHDLRFIRRAKKVGLPSLVLKYIGDVFGFPKGWTMHRDLKINWDKINTKIYVTHGISKVRKKLAKARNSSTIQGHYHTDMRIDCLATPEGFYWDLVVGSLIDDSSLAFEYNKQQLERPLLGCSIIDNNMAKIVPMFLQKGGRWDKVVV